MERKSTENATNKKRMNVIDGVILIVVLACIVGLVVRFTNTRSRADNDNLKSYDVYFSVTDIAYTYEDAFVVGDTFTLADSGVRLGEFVGLESILPAEFFARDKNGNLIIVNYPEATKINVTGKLLSYGMMTENGYLAEGTTYIASGTSYRVQSEHLDVVLKITNVVEK